MRTLAILILSAYSVLIETVETDAHYYKLNYLKLMLEYAHIFNVLSFL